MLATLTPNRQIEVEIDPAETVQVEPFFAKTRMRFEIREPTLTNVEQLASGVWILKPEITSLSVLHETTSGQLKAIPLPDYSAATVIEQIPMQRSLTELTGVSPGPNVAASGDNFYVKRVPALTSWSVSLTPRRPVPTLPTLPNYPLDTVLQHSAGLDVADQGYVLRWIHPAHPQEYIDYVLSFLFGGPITADGYGQFELVFGGDGRAFLFEWIEDDWQQVDEWRYAASELVPGSPHTIRIIPHASRYLEIRTNVTGRTQPGFLFQNRRLTAFSGQSVALDSHVYETTNRGGLPPRGGGAGYNVTGPGHPDFRVRRDVALRWQAARITYPASGTLRDQPFTVPQVDTSSHVLHPRLFSMVLVDPLSGTPHGAVAATIYNALTGAALTPASESWMFGSKTFTLNGFTLPGKPNAVQVQVTLTNNDGAGGPYSPWLFGYEARKVGTNAANQNTSLFITGDHYRQSPVTRLSITGPDHDASHESAGLRVADLVNRCSRLGTRGEGRIRITTTYEANQPAKKSVLFDGYWIKSEARLRGKLTQSYPSPNWHDYDLSCLGMWKRLHERAFLAYEIMSFGTDPDPTTPPVKGVTPPWKVTDAIRFLLVSTGWPESRLDIPDLPIRLWADGTREHDTVTIQPGTNALEFAQKLAEDYLNYYLLPDMNAGPEGMFRLRPLPTRNDPAVWSFTFTPAGAGKIATHTGAYPSNTTWIARDSLLEWPVAPEGNWLRVTGEVNGKLFACEASNPKAYNKPGQNSADPNHPDYTDGRWRPIFRRHDPTLLTREAVIFVTRRIFDQACRAQRFARFTCPLPLIDTSAISGSLYPLYKRRPLLFGDVVNYGDAGEKAMVRECTMMIRKQHHMLARITLQRFNDPLPA